MRSWLYAYNTNGLVHHRLDEAVDLVADLGYEALSLTPDVGHLDPRDATAADVEQLGRHLRRRGLDISMQTGARFLLDPRRKHQPTLLDPDAAARRKRLDFLVRCLDIGRDLGARVLSFWSGAEPPDEAVAELSNRLVAGCRAVAEAAAARGMVAAFEPEPGMWVARLDQWALLHRTVDHPAFQLALDVGHVHCNREGDPASLVREHRGALADVQVEDARAGEHVHLPFGEGTLDIGPTLVALDRIGYRGHVVVELSRDSHRAVAVAEAAITHMKRFVP